MHKTRSPKILQWLHKYIGLLSLIFCAWMAFKRYPLKPSPTAQGLLFTKSDNAGQLPVPQLEPDELAGVGFFQQNNSWHRIDHPVLKEKVVFELLQIDNRILAFTNSAVLSG